MIHCEDRNKHLSRVACDAWWKIDRHQRLEDWQMSNKEKGPVFEEHGG
jgi:hypothetical protein